MESFADVSKELSRICNSDDYNPLDGYDFLTRCTELLIDEHVSDVLLYKIRARKKWYIIKQEYPDLLREIGQVEAIRTLAEKHHYSEKNIQAIIYYR